MIMVGLTGIVGVVVDEGVAGLEAWTVSFDATIDGVSDGDGVGPACAGVVVNSEGSGVPNG